MTDRPERLGAIVLAGGRSSRFGRDKLAEPFGGRPLLERAIDAVGRVATDVVVVAAPAGIRAVPPGVVLVHDADAHEGPLAGLASGLAALDPAVGRVIVVGGDMPTLVPVVLLRLLDQLDAHDLAVLADDAGPRPLPMALRRSTAAPVVDRLLAGGERRLRALITELAVSVIEPSAWRRDDPSGETLRDVDVPEDLPG
jgi:molybdopterin-guanine dinucleotide biosynthesis protein A